MPIACQFSSGQNFLLKTLACWPASYNSSWKCMKTWNQNIKKFQRFNFLNSRPFELRDGFHYECVLVLVGSRKLELRSTFLEFYTKTLIMGIKRAKSNCRIIFYWKKSFGKSFFNIGYRNHYFPNAVQTIRPSATDVSKFSEILRL